MSGGCKNEWVRGLGGEGCGEGLADEWGERRGGGVRGPVRVWWGVEGWGGGGGVRGAGTRALGDREGSLGCGSEDGPRGGVWGRVWAGAGGPVRVFGGRCWARGVPGREPKSRDVGGRARVCGAEAAKEWCLPRGGCAGVPGAGVRRSPGLRG